MAEVITLSGLAFLVGLGAGAYLGYRAGFGKAVDTINEALEREHRLTWERHQKEISEGCKTYRRAGDDGV